MNRTLRTACLCGAVLVLATGCILYRTRAFEAVERPMKFENWRIYVNAFVRDANPSPTNRVYTVGAVAWTAPGDSVNADPRQFRPTAYDARLDSLRLFIIQGTNASEMQLPPWIRGPFNNHLVSLSPTNRTAVEIPAAVRELRADVTLRFRHRETGTEESKVFTTRMLTKEKTKMAPAE